MKSQPIHDEKPLKIKTQKPEQAELQGEHAEPAPPALARLQQQVGNRAVQRLMAQRAAEEPAQLDDETAGQINRARGGGQPLDNQVKSQMETAFGHDFSGVKVHTSPEAGKLNESLHARAFTTGRDIFFNEGEYQPGTSSGQELLAHELTHVVQQGSGQVDLGGQGMTVNSPGDQYEQEADQASQAFLAAKSSGALNPATTAVQAQELPEEEEELQMQEEEEEELQMQEEEEEELQMQELPEEEEEELQMQELPEEEEEELQLQELPEEEEEELQMQEEEEVQMQELPEEEEEIQAKRI